MTDFCYFYFTVRVTTNNLLVSSFKVANGAGKTGKTGKIAFFEIRAGKSGKKYLFIVSKLEKREKHFSQFLGICYIGNFVYTR